MASAISVFAPDTATAVSRPDQLRYGVLILGGVAIGILWQWFSPRDLAYRLALPAGAMVLAGLLFLVPFAGEVTQRAPHPLWFGGGLLAGLILTTAWQQLRAEDPTA